MADAREDDMDLDLNLGPSVPASPDFDPDLGPLSTELGNMEERIRQLEAVAVRSRHRWRWRPGRLPTEARNIPVEMIVSSGVSSAQVGEASVAAEDRITDESNKGCKENASDLVAKALGTGNSTEKGNSSSDGGSFFECNICLDVAKNPVLTCCGHLFCWPCLYQWLHIHSDTKECPVCKGEVTDTNITPIYSRGNDTQELEKEGESGLKVPPRPHARRVESLRQWIHRAVQIEESYFAQMIRRIGNRYDLDTADEIPDRANSLSNRILNRGILREGSARYSLSRPEREIIDLTQGSSGSSESESSRRLPSLRSLRSARSQSSAERLVQAYFRGRPMGRNHTHNPPIEDRDSVSSIAAVIHSESQTPDNTAEIESMMSLSSSSSRRRADASRASFVDSGISRATRRRRLN